MRFLIGMPHPGLQIWTQFYKGFAFQKITRSRNKHFSSIPNSRNLLNSEKSLHQTGVM